ncbi:MAG: hypothetical protein L0332_03210 [Chloroflexi bacterium]|nr:hypothetical protein [Chloroflexota bacterium]MCI0645864.1 hypothetical protein [Chloroflexota bacterium]MCI0725719.1 hypothetical protein [Chloroflexota bacterium]
MTTLELKRHLNLGREQRIRQWLFLFLLSTVLLFGSSCQESGGLELPSAGPGRPGIQPVTAAPTETPKGPLPSSTPGLQAATPTSIPTVTLIPGAVMPAQPGSADGGDSEGDSNKDVSPPADEDDECKTCPFGDGQSSDSGPVIPPTPTPVLNAADAPRFPETPINSSFDATVFITNLGLVRDSFRSFTLDWFPILREERERNRGDCGSYLGWYTLWVTLAPAFASVPPEWESLYIEYRVLLEQAVIITTDIRVICPAVQPGPYARNVDPIPFFTAAYPRIEQMVAEGSQLAP